MHTVQDIDGTNSARAVAGEGLIKLTILAASGFTNGDAPAYFPAESISLDSLEGIAALHQLCGELLDAYAEANQSGVAP